MPPGLPLGTLPWVQTKSWRDCPIKCPLFTNIFGRLWVDCWPERADFGKFFQHWAPAPLAPLAHTFMHEMAHTLMISVNQKVSKL